ncbi:hypothetical protein [Peredibacter starrii]|uniref:Uncharacterized protein n=1 Tax=Peredibacter starrii TaxID=28202 RepID=A0AAX4HNL7_9BACT|nr:hypothetical protein [Peredibacter starrii]WPU64900.1 hypothetical protein SOO65_19580 [Peredibacter starrii]
MKYLIALIVLITFAAHASPFMTVKERLRLDMWMNGVSEDKPVINKKSQQPKKPLPEELERALQKT